MFKTLVASSSAQLSKRIVAAVQMLGRHKRAQQSCEPSRSDCAQYSPADHNRREHADHYANCQGRRKSLNYRRSQLVREVVQDSASDKRGHVAVTNCGPCPVESYVDGANKVRPLRSSSFIRSKISTLRQPPCPPKVLSLQLGQRQRHWKQFEDRQAQRRCISAGQSKPQVLALGSTAS